MCKTPNATNIRINSRISYQFTIKELSSKYNVHYLFDAFKVGKNKSAVQP